MTLPARRLAAIAAAPLLAAATPTGTLTVHVANVRDDRGQIHVDLCRQDQFPKDDCAFAGDAPAQTGETVVTITGLPPGSYAAQAYHDENGNQKVDRSLLGVPREGVGFSNDAFTGLSAPKWARAQFDFAGDAEIRLKLRYLSGAKGPPR